VKMYRNFVKFTYKHKIEFQCNRFSVNKMKPICFNFL
jgi:hypothetical protein